MTVSRTAQCSRMGSRGSTSPRSVDTRSSTRGRTCPGGGTRRCRRLGPGARAVAFEPGLVWASPLASGSLATVGEGRTWSTASSTAKGRDRRRRADPPTLRRGESAGGDSRRGRCIAQRTRARAPRWRWRLPSARGLSTSSSACSRANGSCVSSRRFAGVRRAATLRGPFHQALGTVAEAERTRMRQRCRFAAGVARRDLEADLRVAASMRVASTAWVRRRTLLRRPPPHAAYRSSTRPGARRRTIALPLGLDRLEPRQDGEPRVRAEAQVFELSGPHGAGQSAPGDRDGAATSAGASISRISSGRQAGLLVVERFDHRPGFRFGALWAWWDVARP